MYNFSLFLTLEKMRCFILLIFSVLNFSCVISQDPVLIENEISDKAVHSFPKDFSFGAATAAYQIEGGWKDDGKGPSIWDTLTHNHPELIADHTTADVGPDSYHFYKSDVKALKQVGVNNLGVTVIKLNFIDRFQFITLQFQHYRFSVSWSRIFPRGLRVNKKAFDYYNLLIDNLILQNIEPVNIKAFLKCFKQDRKSYAGRDVVSL